MKDIKEIIVVLTVRGLSQMLTEGGVASVALRCRTERKNVVMLYVCKMRKVILIWENQRPSIITHLWWGIFLMLSLRKKKEVKTAG